MEWNAVFKLLHALTNMIQTKVTYKWGVSEIAPEIEKCILMGRKALVTDVMDELTFVPKTMNGVTVSQNFWTVVYSIKNNRKSQGRR